MERMSTPELEEEKRCGPRNWGLEAIKVRGVRAQGVGGGSWAQRRQMGHCMSPLGPGAGAEEFGGLASGDHRRGEHPAPHRAPQTAPAAPLGAGSHP